MTRSFAWPNPVARLARTSRAILGLTIPVLAMLGPFSLSGGIRHLMRDTMGGVPNLMALGANAPGPALGRPYPAHRHPRPMVHHPGVHRGGDRGWSPER